MTRTPFDQFSKQFLEEFLTPLGEVEISREVPGEPRFIDIRFAPSPQPTSDQETLGLLGKIAATPCLIEPFRNQPTPTEVRNCLLKLFLVHADFQRQARREDDRVLEAELPRLWILASSASNTFLNGFGARLSDEWIQGVNLLPESLKAAIVAINQLPHTEDTLWVRILGKGSTQQQAIEEVIALPVTDSRRSKALRLLASWKITIETSTNIDEEGRQLSMTLSQAYLEWERETERRGIEQGLQRGIQQGVEQGIEQGQRLVVENLLRVRFGALDEQLSTIIPLLLELPTQEYTRLLLQLSREELLARFDNPAS